MICITRPGYAYELIINTGGMNNSTLILHVYNMIKRFTNKVVTLIIGVILVITCICAVSTQQEPIQTIQIEQISTDTISPSDSIRNELVQATNDYITQKFPKSKLTGEALVTACEKHDFDICFALAQAEIESGFGTAGKAKRTNSPWNVGAWSGRSAQTMNKMGYGYAHPDQSIEPYIELIKSKYLGTRRTIHDLMNNYVALSGHRYASDPNYERILKSTYRRICRKTTIKPLQESLRQI